MRPHLTKKHRSRLSRLRDMEYSPRELAFEIGANKATVAKHWIKLSDCPHRRDAKGHIWINGATFRTWALALDSVRGLAENEALCCHCRAPRPIQTPSVRPLNRNIYVSGTCPVCQHKIGKFFRS